MTPEYSVMIDPRQIGIKPVVLEPGEAERRKLAGRFGLSRIDHMRAEVALEAEGQTVRARGRLKAHVMQPCAVSGEDFPVTIDEPIDLRFVPAGTHAPGEEIELDAQACDEIEYEGTSFDLGEAAAQTLALAIDPFAEGPGADAFRKAAGLTDESSSGPFAALAALRKDD